MEILKPWYGVMTYINGRRPLEWIMRTTTQIIMPKTNFKCFPLPPLQFYCLFFTLPPVPFAPPPFTVPQSTTQTYSKHRLSLHKKNIFFRYTLQNFTPNFWCKLPLQTLPPPNRWLNQHFLMLPSAILFKNFWISHQSIPQFFYKFDHPISPKNNLVFFGKYQNNDKNVIFCCHISQS